MKITNVALMMHDGAQLLDFAGPHDVLNAANQVLAMRRDNRRYKISLFSENQSVRISGDQNIELGIAEVMGKKIPKFDTVIVVGGQNLIERKSISNKTLAWITGASKTARRTVSICAGAFVLAAAGLLDNRRAATHWLHCKELQKRYPKIDVDGDSIWLRDGPIYTSAGVCSGIDLTLALVEEDHGASVALAVARGLVVYLRRPGSQSQFSQLLKQQHSNTGEFKELVPWMVENLHKELAVEFLARKCSMSPRHFARQFAAAFDTTPAKFVTKLRMESAKSMLSESELSIDQISNRCGFSSSDVFRKSFLRSLELTPVEYRRLWRS